jgi:uncharacterized membrane protein
MMLASALFSTAFLYAEAAPVVAAVAGVGVVVLAGSLWWSFRTKKGVRAKPQFTRQSMREREMETGGFDPTGDDDG